MRYRISLGEHTWQGRDYAVVEAAHLNAARKLTAYVSGAPVAEQGLAYVAGYLSDAHGYTYTEREGAMQVWIPASLEGVEA